MEYTCRSLSKKHALLAITMVITAFLGATGFAAEDAPGEALFRKHCSSCHPHASKMRKTNNVERVIRNPPPFMPKYDAEKIPDRDVQAIADFIRKTALQKR